MAKRTTKKGILKHAVLRTGLVALAALLYIVSPKADAQTPTPISSCGNISGSVILSTNLTTGNAACLIVTGNNTTIDGNGKTITALNDAVAVASKSTVTIRNIVTSKGINISGTSSNVTVENSTTGFIGVYSADDVTINNVTMTGVAVQGSDTNSALRATFTNNTVTGSGSTLADFMGSTVGPCPRADFVVTDNTFTSSYTCSAGTCDEPKVLFMRCGTHNTVARNMIRSTGQAMGLRLRDEFDYSTVSDNTVWVNTSDAAFGAFNITAGNLDKHHPRNNTITRNLIRADNDVALYLQSSGNNNTFSYNTVWSNDNYAGNSIGNAPGTNIFNHNTFVNRGTGRIAYVTYSNASADTWTNNIFAYEGRETFWFDGWAFSRYTGNNNLFYSRTGAAQFSPYGGSLAGWKSAASPDDSASIEGNPLFTNATSGDFSLGASSPARLAATDGTAIGAWQPAAQCTENWSCGNWSSCAGGTQVRTCTDANSCGTTTNRPPLSQSCVMSCTESWVCSDWGLCSNSTQTRTCTDANSCGTTTNRPPLSQSCTETSGCTESWICTDWAACTNGNQGRTCTDLNSCGTTVEQPPLSQSCASDTTPPNPVSNLGAQ